MTGNRPTRKVARTGPADVEVDEAEDDELDQGVDPLYGEHDEHADDDLKTECQTLHQSKLKDCWKDACNIAGRMSVALQHW